MMAATDSQESAAQTVPGIPVPDSGSTAAESVSVIADLAICAALVVCAVMLTRLLRRQRDTRGPAALWLFAVFGGLLALEELLVAVHYSGVTPALHGLFKSAEALAAIMAVVALVRELKAAGLPYVTQQLAQAGVDRDQAENRFRQIVESAPHGMVMVDREGRIVLVNRQVEQIFGWTREELVGRPLEMLVPERFREGHPAMREAYFAEPATRAMGAGRDLFGRYKDGREFPVELGLTPLEIGGEALVLAAVVDIRERVQIERQNRRLAGLLEQSYDSAIAWTPQAGILFWNQGAERLYGYSRDQAVGQIGHELLQTRFPNGVSPVQIEAELSRHGVWEGELTQTRHDGREIVVESRMKLVRLENTDTVLEVNRDVTERRQAERDLAESHARLEARVEERTAQLQNANQELESFSYSVSHDLRAPLRAIDGFSRILMNDFASQLPADAAEYLQDIRTNAQQMGRLIDDLLLFSRMSRQALVRQPVDTSSLVADCLRELQADQGRAAVCVSELPACTGDPGLLKQVWINLLANAFKYSSRSSEPVIEIGSTHRAGDREVAFFVKDNGVGFDMRYYGKLFGVFQRLHRFEDFPGTGVGLAIVQRIVQRHGGRVWATASPNAGATFFFTLS